MRLTSEIPTETLMRCIINNPRKVLGLETASIEEGAKADLTLFGTSDKWQYELSNNQSLSANSYFLGQEMIGQVYGTVNGSKLHLNF